MNAPAPLDPAKAIRIGTMISASGGKAAQQIAALADLGFESFEPFFWQTTNGQDLAELGKRCRDAIGNRDITISTLGMFGNPLEEQPHDLATLEGWKDCIDNAHHFGATCVAGFTRQACGGQGCPHRLRELRHGRQLGDRGLEHRPQSRRLGADVQRDP
jgi:sugar phosphate isomerase/epimerase